MEQNPDTRFTGGKGLALVGVSLALVGANKTGQEEIVQPVVKDYHEMSFAQGSQTEGHLALAANSSTSTPAKVNASYNLHPHHALSKYCANIAGGNPKERVKFGVINYFEKKGLKPAQAAGIDGNFGQEVDWDPTELLGQWGGGRLAALERYASRLGKPVTSMIVQLKYTWLELTNGPGAGEDDRPVLRHLRGTKTAAEAATVFSNEYERPGIPALENRILYAEQVLRKFGHMACNDTARPGVKARIAIPAKS